MSLNWVMLHDREGFVRLPNEQLMYTSPPRTSFSLQPLSSYTGSEALSIQSSAGWIHLTNQRIVYLPAQKTKDFQSFSVPLLNVYDSHVTAPFFGPNVWTAFIQPVAGGGIPPSLPAVHLKVTFKDGGAFDFHTYFERIKERLHQAVENTTDSNGGSGIGQRNVDLTAVHLEDLPAYDGPNNYVRRETSPDYTYHASNESASDARDEPLEPPPGYEEVQQQSVANELEDRLRRRV